MARVAVHEDLDLDSPVLVEGLPGVGLVGKIAADHLVGAFGMTHYASCHCEGLPKVAVYEEGDPGVKAPVRIYADEDRDLLALQSDVPVSPQRASSFSGCLTGWLVEHDVFPIYLSGLAQEKDGKQRLYGVGTGDGEQPLAEHGIDTPRESGLVSGPTGALLADAAESNLDGVGLVVQSNAQFPDPEAARVVLVDAVGPIAGVDVDTDRLVDQAEQIATAREELARQMQRADEGSTQAQSLRMYQ